MTARTYQTVVYGDTPGGCMAAVSSAINNPSGTVCLICPPAPGFDTSHVGGMMANGLGNTDGGHYFTHIIGSGPTGEFFLRNTRRYGTFAKTYAVEPHGAEETFGDMLRFYGVDILPNVILGSITMSGSAIATVLTINPLTNAAVDTITVTSSVIDMTYEGDLMALVPSMPFTIGRESNNFYLLNVPGAGTAWMQAMESVGGFNPSSLFTPPFNNLVSINPYISGTTGPLLPQVSPMPATPIGGADSRIMAYGYRMCLTQNKFFARAFTQPAGYDESLFELAVRSLGPGSIFRPGSIINGKYDLNTDYVDYDSDPSGGVQAWPAATWAQRALIGLQIYNQQAGWLYYLQANNGTPSQIQTQIAPFGLSVDEFRDNSVYTVGWPRLPYVREARRMIGQYVMTQTDIQTALTKTDVVSMGCYSIDCHTCGQYPFGSGSGVGYIQDSNANVPSSARATMPYQIPYRSYLPQQSICTNLLVGGAASFSHVAFCSFRIEHTWMNAGVACGTAAGLAAAGSASLQSFASGSGLTALQAALTSMGQVLSYTPA